MHVRYGKLAERERKREKEKERKKVEECVKSRLFPNGNSL
jgi:hypothetical protein